MSNGYLNIESMLLKSAEDEKKIKGLLEFEVIIPRYEGQILVRNVSHDELLQLIKNLGLQVSDFTNQDLVNKKIEKDGVTFLKKVATFVYKNIINPNFEENFAELAGKFKTNSKYEILQKFFTLSEIMTIFGEIMKKHIELLQVQKKGNLEATTAIEDLKKK